MKTATVSADQIAAHPTQSLLASDYVRELYEPAKHRELLKEIVFLLIQTNKANGFTAIYEAVEPRYRGLAAGHLDKVLQALRKAGRIKAKGGKWSVVPTN